MEEEVEGVMDIGAEQIGSKEGRSTGPFAAEEADAKGRFM